MMKKEDLRAEKIRKIIIGNRVLNGVVNKSKEVVFDCIKNLADKFMS